MIQLPFTDSTLMPFGKHQGKPVGTLSTGYMKYLHDAKIARGELLKYIIEHVPELKHWYSLPEEVRKERMKENNLSLKK